MHLGTSQMQIAMMCTKLFPCLQSTLPKCCSSHQSLACSYMAFTQQMHLSLDTSGHLSPCQAFTFSPFHLSSVSRYHLFIYSPLLLVMCTDRSPDNVCKQQLDPGGDRGHFPVPLGWLPKTGSFTLPGGKVCAGVRADRCREDSHCRSSCSCSSGQVCTAVLAVTLHPFQLLHLASIAEGKSPDCMLQGYTHILTMCAVRQQCVQMTMYHSLLNDIQGESC